MPHGYTSLEWEQLRFAASARNAAWWAALFAALAVVSYAFQAVLLLLNLRAQLKATRSSEASTDATKNAVLLSEKSLKHAESTSKAQLRAYIDVAGADIHNVKVGFRPLVNVGLKNGGLTPARSVTLLFNIELLDYPSAPGAPVDLTGHPASKTSLPSQQITTIFLVQPELTRQDIEDLEQNRKALYVWGHVEYEDIFGDRHRTSATFFYNARSGPVGQNVTMTGAHTGNETL